MDDFKKAFVIGWPIEHSRSPLIHTHWLTHHKIRGSYEKIAVEPDQLADFLESLEENGFVGGNVTMPHKEPVFALADHIESDAQRLGAVNTLWRDKGKLNATNTDGYGFLANLDDRSVGWDNETYRKRGALVLGAGGAARGIVDSLVQRGFKDITIANRTLDKAKDLAGLYPDTCHAASMGELPKHVQNAALIVNTTSLGMHDNKSPLDLSGFNPDTMVNDIVYTPLKTPLLKQANELGMKAVDGLGMLLHQAVPGFERWFGVRPKVTDALRDLILRDLGEIE